MSNDPFGGSDNDYSDPWGTPGPAAAPEPSNERPAPAATRDPEAITTTFKQGTGYDAPWVVVRAGSVAEATAILNREFAEYLELVKKVAAAFSGGGAAPARSGGYQQQQRSAQSERPARQQPPAGAPEAPGPEWEYKTGVTKSGPKAGQTWQGWFPPRGADEKPKFFN